MGGKHDDAALSAGHEDVRKMKSYAHDDRFGVSISCKERVALGVRDLQIETLIRLDL